MLRLITPLPLPGAKPGEIKASAMGAFHCTSLAGPSTVPAQIETRVEKQNSLEMPYGKYQVLIWREGVPTNTRLFRCM